VPGLADLELYLERGYDKTTTGDIAARAGVTERTFFRHFADKREVFFDGEAAAIRRWRTDRTGNLHAHLDQAFTDLRLAANALK
jgi:AcrR family transcriptional regulator